MTRVSGCTYDYTITPLTGLTEGRYSRLCGGFYQGFFKLSDQTFFDDISNNMFTWPLDWFTCPPDCCKGVSGNTCTSASTCNCGCNCQLCGTIFAKDYVGGCSSSCSCGGKGDGGGGCCPNPIQAYQCYKDKKPIPYNYQVLPTRYEQGWTSMFWLRKDDDDVCSGNTATTLNDVYSGNTGFFFYMGTRSENKFWDLFSGETGYTTTSGYPLPPPKETKEELLTNPFLVYQPQGCNCFTGINTVTTQERDRNLDIVNNALGFRIKSDGSIGYRVIGVSGVCSAVTSTTVAECCDTCNCITNCQLCGTIFAEDYVGGCGPECGDCGNPKCLKTGTTITEKWVTGTTVTEEYSDPGIIYSDSWIHISIRFRAYEEYIGC